MVKSTQQHNAATRIHDQSPSSPKRRQFTGIRMRKRGKWVSEVRMPNSRERIWLGSYDTPQQAARAHDAAVYWLRGRKARLNFPGTPPKIPSASSLSRNEIRAAAARFALDRSPRPSVDDAGEPRPPSTLRPESSSSSGSEVQPAIEREFWESFFADSHTIHCSNLDIFASLATATLDFPLSLQEGPFDSDQTDLGTL